MRNWIDLFENAFFNAVKTMAPHDTSARPGYGHDLDGNEFLITDDRIIDMHDKINTLLKRNPTIYRFILLRPDELAKFLQGPLGTYWCHEPDGVPLEALTGWDSAPDDAELYRLAANVQPEDVDMARTVLQNLAVPWESEINLKRGVLIKLVGVDLLPNVEQSAHPVRQPFPMREYVA